MSASTRQSSRLRKRQQELSENNGSDGSATTSLQPTRNERITSKSDQGKKADASSMLPNQRETEITNGDNSSGKRKSGNKKVTQTVSRKRASQNSSSGRRKTDKEESPNAEQENEQNIPAKQEEAMDSVPRKTGSSEAKRGKTSRSKVTVKVEDVANEADDESETSPSEAAGQRSRGRKRASKENKKFQSSGDNEDVSVSAPSKPKRSRNTKVAKVKEERAKVKQEKAEVKQELEGGEPSAKKSTWRGKKTEKAAEGSGDGDVKVKNTSLKMGGSKKGEKSGKFVGAHCSISGGMWNAVTDAVTIGAKSFALFLRSQRQWQAKPLEDDVAERFREACAKHGFPPHLILPHGSYLLNCGSPNPETLSKSQESLVDELRRCEKLGLTLYNFHPGSTCGQITVDECLDKIGECINMALAKTTGVTAVIENMSCQGNTVGGRFEELRGIIDRVKDKSRIGVCLDTCHAFAAGFDLSTESGFKQMMADFDRIVGFQYLKGVHINDSKGEVGCHLDRHENIGEGKIGVKGFQRVMNDPRFNNIPLILETPPEGDYAQEIKMLYSLVE